MNDLQCLYTLMFLPHERIEDLLLDEFAPLARELADRPDLDSLFFVRFSEPRGQLRFRVVGEPPWVDSVRERLAPRLDELRVGSAIESFRFTHYDREVERYGGELGMRLAERLYFHDSMAAIELCDAERRGLIAKPRREIGLLFTDRMLDLAGLERRQRLAFYRHGYAWAIETGDWN